MSTCISINTDSEYPFDIWLYLDTIKEHVRTFADILLELNIDAYNLDANLDDMDIKDIEIMVSSIASVGSLWSSYSAGLVVSDLINKYCDIDDVIYNGQHYDREAIDECINATIDRLLKVACIKRS